MAEVKLALDERRRGGFYLDENGKKVGEMVVGISDTTMTVYHTEVDPELEGKGLARLMLDAMVQYARKEKLQVLPLCEYVHLQFKRHADDYADIWKKY